ncbi:MAG: radical SAM protein [Planctomycetota bacterium]|nr:radical SAM protein [Planctomycetota bacterium]
MIDWFSRRSRQESFVFEVTTRCNHDCLHCYNAWKNGEPYPAGELPTGETLAMLGKMLDETQARLVTLSGGEPLLRADLGEIVDYLAGRGVAINLICNGVLLDAAAIERIGPRRVSVFELPLLSVEREIHDRMSGAAGACDKVTMAVAELKAAGAIVVTVFVATKLNLPTWPATAELAIALGADGIMFNRFNPGGEGGRNVELLQASPAELTGALDAAEALAGTYEIPISCSIAMPPCLFDTGKYKRLTFGFCAAGSARAYYTLDPVGNVRPCNHSPRVLGNIRETSFRSMTESAAMKSFMSARPAFCGGCKLELECQGGCKAAAEACYGDASLCDPFLAAFSGQAVKPI